MTVPDISHFWLLITGVGAVIFNAGGFVLLTRNHLHHVQLTLQSISNRLNNVEQRLSRIEGRLEK